MLAAAHPVLTRAGESSSLSDPTENQALVVQRQGLRTRNAATWVRVQPGALEYDCLFFDNPIRTQRTHDVAEAYRLAMSDVRVRLPLGAFSLASGGPFFAGRHIRDERNEAACRKAWESACFGRRKSSVQI